MLMLIVSEPVRELSTMYLIASSQHRILEPSCTAARPARDRKNFTMSRTRSEAVNSSLASVPFLSNPGILATDIVLFRYPHSKLLEINSHSLFSRWFSESGKLVQRLFSNIMELAEDDDTF